MIVYMNYIHVKIDPCENQKVKISS